MEKDPELLAWIASVIQQCQNDQMYGEIVVKMESGTIVNVQKKVNYKPPQKKD